jgi:hypothetical protein
MFSAIKKIFWDLVNSFKTTEGGFSARKCSAFIAVTAAIKISVLHSTPDNAFMLVCANYLFALLCLGLVTAANLIELKTGRDESEPVKKEEPVI